MLLVVLFVGGGTGMKGQQTKEAFIQLRATGQSFEKIAATLGVSKQTLISWSRVHRVELENAKAIARDAQLRRFELHELGRIELLGEMLKKLREEVMSRDLSSIDTPKLFELILKTSKSAAATGTSLTLRSQERDTDWLTSIVDETSWQA
jgi:transposase-like protein